MVAQAMRTVPPPRSDSDAALLDWVQQSTLDYFWSFAHPKSGMARERSNPVPGYQYLETVTTGGTGFGIMALIAGAARGFVAVEAVRERLRSIVDFLNRAETYHGVFPHFLHGETGAAIPFSQQDDGGDLVETAFLTAGLLCARQFFSGRTYDEIALRNDIDRLWRAVEWDWYTRGRNVLYWHWSPRHGWDMNHPITGWNECLITYVLAASSPTHPVGPHVYHHGWNDSPSFRNGNRYYGIALPLGPAFGGPLFFSHYSFLGLDPRSLRDRYADYWQQNRAHSLINRAHCIANPGEFAGYGRACWGLTACDGDAGYDAFSPTNDQGIIAPTAALSSMPYTPQESMQVVRHLHADPALRGRFGFVDAFNMARQWHAESNLAINQGPIIVMIENHRTGMLWDLFMSCEEVRTGLRILGFVQDRLAVSLP
jgi:hypothetical protein